MSRSASSSMFTRAVIVLILASAAIFAVTASGVLGGGPKPSGSPIPSPAPTANPTPTATPTPTSTPMPTQPPAGGPIKLDIATDHDVSVVITDGTGTLRKAVSGRAGDGMSVRWGDWKAENVDESTVRLTWVGLPRDEELTLSITETGGRYELKLVQAAPPVDSDAVGFDRVLVLTFDAPVSADDINVTFAVATA